MNKHYSTETKISAIQEYLNGKSLTDISKEIGASRSTLYSWIEKEKHNFSSNPKLNLRDYHFLKEKCERQDKIIEILKKSPCTVSAKPKVKYAVIQNLKSEYSESLLCDALDVAKGSYYNHIFRNKKETSIFVEREAELTPVIEEIYFNSKCLYGPGKVQAIMKEKGYNVSERFVARIMHEHNWFAARTSSKTLYELNMKIKRNILNQEFKVNRPNEVWVSDITEFKVKNKCYYICVIMDLYARKIIAYKISDKNSTRLTKSTFMYAYSSRLPDNTNLLFHSDNGVNYTSKTFMKCLMDLGIRQSFSRPGIPYDNSVMESFFKAMKAEELYIGRYKSINDFQKSVSEYISFYNNDRPHSFLRYTTPNKYENKYWACNNT